MKDREQSIFVGSPSSGWEALRVLNERFDSLTQDLNGVGRERVSRVIAEGVAIRRYQYRIIRDVILKR